VNSARAVHSTYSGTTPEQACNARARAWAFVFECFHRRENQEGGPATAPKDDAKESKRGVAAKNRTR
jgi:hypothetical protein